MELGADRFEQKLPLLEELVLGSDFLGLDIEFTGLRSIFPKGQQTSLFDSPAEWYLKTKKSIQQFTVCQIGLSMFSSMGRKSNKYIAHSYNFFLFPTTLGIMDSEFSFQASSILFLNQYGFDYNKFLKNGIPYMNEEQEKKIKQDLLTGNWKVRSTLDKDQMKVVIDEVTRWLEMAQEGDWMTLPDITGFQAFEVQLVLRQALPTVWTLMKDKGPLVGHNMMMDLLHLHEKFYRPLPESYEQFKLNIHGLFPVLIDTKNVTKQIWKELSFPRASNLLEVYEVLNSDLNPTKNSCPVIIHASECIKYVETKYPHEAAYDAFLCGSVLLKVAHLLLYRTTGGIRMEPTFPQYLDVLAPYVNQVNLIRACISKINFSGPDSPSNRPPTLILKVKRWPGVDEEQVYYEFKDLCKFDVRRFTCNQFLLMTNKFKDVRIVLQEYRYHPDLQVTLYRYWRHSPNINCILQICGVVTTWAFLAFILGGSPSIIQ
ncbi:poly(A)-specific ribonuclease PNLDC1-like isoform X4 [Vombatus ursinus]|uniref:poly(A)-specific ribonuclease PNLDC1-like isoform X4 n=1 Tax=Vombatus ursinus TaxID=29139 RepID=UPI000FFDB50F|nr:poly(A)-specific ribonuclease PNLDC1-like isoform X4 [Vombatus ursinus]XP_027702408.1 poly(A)-specific ribonuclease PNLDC1-like isoform X4 [Vombatus ursinus]